MKKTHKDLTILKEDIYMANTTDRNKRSKVASSDSKPTGVSKNVSDSLKMTNKSILLEISKKLDNLPSTHSNSLSSHALPSPQSNNRESIEKDEEKLIDKFLTKTEDVLKKNNDVLKNSVLGPLTLITKPIEDFFGFDLGEKFRKFVFGGGKPSKKNPKPTDVAKIGIAGAGYLYIANTIKEIFGKEGLDEKEGFFGQLFKPLTSLFGKLTKMLSGLLGGGLFKKMLPKSMGGGFGKVGKAFGIGSIIAGLIMAITDGIKAVVQNKFGTSKISSFIGGFFGGLDSGVKGVFSNMGKWALIGAGIGTVVPVVGTLLGGLIGATIGGVLGYIGGEKIAKFTDKIGNFFKEKLFPSIKNFIFEMFNIQQFIDIWSNKDKSIVSKIGATLGAFTRTIFMLPFKFINKVGTKFLELKKLLSDPKTKKTIVDGISKFFKSFFETVKKMSNEIFTKVKDSIVKFFKELFNGWIDGVTNGKFKWDSDKGIWENIKDLAVSIFTSVGDAVRNWFDSNPIGKWIKEKIWTPIVDWFGQIKDMFEILKYVWEEDGIRGIAKFLLDKDEYGNSDYDRYMIELAKQKKDMPNAVSTASVLKTAIGNRDVKVNDAIIRPDGSVIKTNPNDTLVALKDIPTSANTLRMENQNELKRDLSDGVTTNYNVNNQMNTLIKLLTKLVDKEPTNITLPSMTRQDLDFIMNGAIV